MIVAAIAGAAIVIVLGIQALIAQLRDHGLDARSPGSLFDTTNHQTWVARSAELETLTAVVSESMSSEGVARTKLWPLLDDLATAPGPGDQRRDQYGGTRSVGDGPRLPTRPGGGRRRESRRRRDRRRELSDTLDELEARWGVGSHSAFE